MAGTTVRDDGAVEAAFTTALEAVGVDRDSPRFDTAQATINRTMGQSKADVFATLLAPQDAEGATAAFAAAYEASVARGGVSAMLGAPEVFGAPRAHGVLVCLTTGFAPTTPTAPHTALIAGIADLISTTTPP